jgi:acyl-CoA synthetase (AMP-forming)/AMP-acid ligase II/1-acyl-sn-glycerol-3-phosphate acyltransferase/acyl carrier protein
MLNLLRYPLWALVRLLISLRYRIVVHGAEQLRGLKGRTLILPNHAGYIDPVLLLTLLWMSLRPRPMLLESSFRDPLLHPLLKLLNAVRVPDLERPSAQAREQAQQAIAEVIEGLRRGESIVLWPAGRAERDGLERLGSAEAAAKVLRSVPEAEVVLVRTRGIWGSMFSYALTGGPPSLMRRLATGLGVLLANFLLFTPRRRVDITVEHLDRRRLPELERDKVNRWLEEWYNVGGPEKPNFVPYHFLLGPRTYRFPPPQEMDGPTLSAVKPQTRAAIAEILADQVGRPLGAEELKPETTLDQLGLDSLKRMDLMQRVEERFGHRGEQAPLTVGQLWALAEGFVQRKPAAPPPHAWFRPPSGTQAVEILGDTLAEAYITCALSHLNDVAAADDLAGAVRHRRLLAGVLALSHRFRQVSAPAIGLLLPASVACDMAFLALQLAGKLPVILNWTTGSVNLQHAVRLMGLSHVVSSRQFRDRLNVPISGVQYLDMEELRRDIGWFEAVWTLLVLRLWPGSIRRRIPRPSPDQPAVVLFTSGSERAPKAVPLTHRNLLSNQRGTVAAVEPTRCDSLLGCLPMFHSFGLTVTGLIPLLGGVRVVHHPDPTDAVGLIRKAAAYRPTLLIGTPTLVGSLFAKAEPQDLSSLRLIFVGAERCPPDLFESCRRLAPGATLLEGYGVTECSPIVAFNLPQASRPGTVGLPLPGVEVRVVDLQTGEALPAGQMGMLLVSGSTVFPGYIGDQGPPPFVGREGKRWYVTGDLVEADVDGFLYFRGRLKRFLKAGGEMISLPALEEPFARRYPPAESGPRVAVEGMETEAGCHIVLFTTDALNLREANAILREEGFRGVMRLDQVRRLERIPVLGTGKTDYKVLRGMVAAPQPDAMTVTNERI